ncbi:MAG TPA: aminotransferase class I/II-fold pyridoxal phosphate-dependent enzyme [Terriglobales bacterium]|nr:aminotransferase class I/II-fold pyridoxal phosphate-dependent enzyme [Terriglobales bacterium]
MLKSIPPAGTQIKFAEIFGSLSSILSKGHSSEEFRQRFCEYFQVKDCFLTSSGRAALTLILKTLKRLRNKDEVIIPAYTCFSVPSAIAKAGLKIKLCDISLETLDLDSEKWLNLIDENTLAVLPVYHFGLAHSNMDIIAHCREKKVFVIEDVAQAMGAKFRNQYLGTFGDVGFFSLGRGKNITAVEGGIILSQDEEVSSLLKQELSNLRKTPGIEFFCKTLIYKIFLNPHLYWIPEGIPALKLGESEFSLDFDLHSLSEYQAKVGASLLHRLEDINRIRIRNASYLISGLKDSDNVSLFPLHDESYSVYLRLPILFKDSSERERVFQSLKKKKLGASKMYPTSLDKIPGIEKYLASSLDELVKSHQVEKTILTLPTHPYLKENDLHNIIEIIKEGGK